MRLAPLPFLLAVLLSTYCFPQSDLDTIKADYQSVSVKLQRHIVDDWWLDDAPRAPLLLSRKWKLTGQWVAEWLNNHPSASASEIIAATKNLDSNADTDSVALNDHAFLVLSANGPGNVFIVAKSNEKYRLAWSISQQQKARGHAAVVLAAWHADRAREGGRGPYWAPSGAVGSMKPTDIHLLPADSRGHVRFYLDGYYEQGAGGTVGGQISIWSWNGKTAAPLFAKDYFFSIGQEVVARLEGNLLKVQEKKRFHSFGSCGQCEERQTELVLRITPDRIENLGERSTVPELDAVDQLLFRTITHRNTVAIASTSAAKAAKQIVSEARENTSEQDWKELPYLGMMLHWYVHDRANGKEVCLELDQIESSAHIFTLRKQGAGYFVTEIHPAPEFCGEK